MANKDQEQHPKPAAPARKPRTNKPKGDAKKVVATAAPLEELPQIAQEQPAPEPTVGAAPVAKSPSKADKSPAKTTPGKATTVSSSAPDLLSPVSRLDMARELAAKEQQERIALASARRVDDARRKSLKRKDIDSDVVMPEKVPKTRSHDSTDDEDVQVIESTTVMHTTSTLTHRRNAKKTMIEQDEGESATAYALRAAKIRKDERVQHHHHVAESTHTIIESHNAEETKDNDDNAPRTAYERKQLGGGAAPTNIYDAPPHATAAPEFVNDTVKAAPIHRNAKATDVVEDVSPVDATTTRFYVHLAILLVVVFTVLLGLTEMYVSQLPFCNTDASTDLNCRLCPANAVCADGRLASCVDTFVAVGDDCIPSNQVKRNSALMVLMAQAIVAETATAAYCQTSFVSRVVDADWSLPVQRLADVTVSIPTDVLEAQLRDTTLWQSVKPRTFGVTFKRALDKMNITTESIPVTLDQASVPCQVATYAYQYLTIWVSAIAFLFGLVLMYADQKQSEADVELLHKMLVLVQDELITHANGHEDKRYAAHYLKNHVLDVMKLTKAEKARVESVLWTQLGEMVAREARIRVSEGPDGAIMWEWEVVVEDRSTEPIVGGVPVAQVA
ncbi:Aste57867_25115 [Aphanomyces stellatus]|uniref:Aste57867_25115 protein n=1 Tax=Aphanomyces stellatus TaxID=120398 RepID=A0A485LSA4_9STRA|nr:hypothetical protein As57867_025037 [Aphanomyces stellatus]VFU01746.1 Aste57867_25115 [Aphanomyces stellatus]